MTTDDTTTDAPILVLGAGAAGLLAARTLAQAGRPVQVLEARNRVGGRIQTLTGGGFSGPTEAGAEFLHGNVPLTRSLLRRYGIGWRDTDGRAYEVAAGRARESEAFLDDLPLLLQRLRALPHDLPLAEFLVRYFPEPGHQRLREQVTRFAEGYDAADASRASAFALRDEWSGNGAEDSPRPAGGYGGLVAGLARELRAAGGRLALQAHATAVAWESGRVAVSCADGRTFRGSRLLLTVPLGIWQAQPGQPGHLPLTPELPTHRAAARALGFGPVIKVLLEFDAPFWEQAGLPGLAQPLPALGFVFSDAAFPTWWSQRPHTRPLLTGWVAGPAAWQRRQQPAAVLLAEALEALAYLLDTTPALLRSHLRAHHVANWAADPLALGAYAYSTVGAAAARAALAAPVAGTLFVAGEGTYDGPHIGTVEAALASGAAAARQLLARP